MIRKTKYNKENFQADASRNFTYEGKIAPSAIDIEKSILGAILIDNLVFSDVISILKPDHFFNKNHATIYRTMMDMENKNEPIDARTLIDELRKNKTLDDIGGVDYIIDIGDCVTSSAFVKQHSLIVYHKYILRDLIYMSGRILEDCFDSSADPFKILNEASKKILDTSESISKQKLVSITDEVEKVFSILGARRSDKKFLVGVTSGYNMLDDYTLGFQKSELIIVAGRPSHGKTALTLNIARNAAMKNYKVAFFSLEMTKMELITRLLSSEAKIDSYTLKKGTATDIEWARISQAMSNLKVKLFLDDTSDMTVLELRAKARRLKHDEGLDMVIVDYLQLLKGEGYYERRDLEVAHISRSLKALAKELDIPVIAAAQVNRGIEQRGKEKKPQLSDLRESGSIEQDADVVMFIFREFLINRPDPNADDYEEQKRKAELIIAKQRNGPVGTVKLLYETEYARFENEVKRQLVEIPKEQGDIQTPF